MAGENGLNIVGYKSINGQKAAVLQNGLVVGGKFHVDNNKTIVGDSPLFVFGTPGKDSGFNIAAMNSYINLGNGCDEKITVFGSKNVIQAVNTETGCQNSITIKGYDNSITTGSNTQVTLDGQPNSVLPYTDNIGWTTDTVETE